jgi:hypothetical protein
MSDDYAMYEELAKKGTLPADFDQWELANEYNWTVAHVAAGYGHLPAGFSQWDITTKSGWTVAHVAASMGHLPTDLADFAYWDLTDYSGKTVSQLAPETYKRWQILRGLDDCQDMSDTQISQMI